MWLFVHLWIGIALLLLVLQDHLIDQYKIKALLDWMMCNEKTIFALQSRVVDKTKGGNRDLGQKAVFPRSQSSMAAELERRPPLQALHSARAVVAHMWPHAQGRFPGSLCSSICSCIVLSPALLRARQNWETNNKGGVWTLAHPCPKFSDYILYHLLLLFWGFLLRDVQLEGIHVLGFGFYLFR